MISAAPGFQQPANALTGPRIAFRRVQIRTNVETGPSLVQKIRDLIRFSGCVLLLNPLLYRGYRDAAYGSQLNHAGMHFCRDPWCKAAQQVFTEFTKRLHWWHSL